MHAGIGWISSLRLGVFSASLPPCVLSPDLPKCICLLELPNHDKMEGECSLLCALHAFIKAAGSAVLQLLHCKV